MKVLERGGIGIALEVGEFDGDALDVPGPQDAASSRMTNVAAARLVFLTTGRRADLGAGEVALATRSGRHPTL